VSASSAPSYLVVARRYRPRSFAELIGQGHVVQGLINAITTDRVGHAYLFTGARGVGKTSTARIFAKCLNAPDGPTAEPDNTSEICRQIDAGEDIDVIEIDGASNRGIEEIRQLRANVSVRPSRSRYKIYIIDEVHMLTAAAFNALLKTLEEPPAHVKFIFCTTDPDKIPITVRSRCQRFDFAPVAIAQIVERLEQIVQQEGREADPEALRLLAHRAGGSVRDSQSLLEQLLAFAEGRLTVDTVHALLGTAGDEKLARLVQGLVRGDAGEALAIVDACAAEGLDLGQLTEQLLQVYRDGLVAEAGGDASLRHFGDGPVAAAVDELRRSLGLSGLSAAMQLLDQTLTRMQLSVHARALVELVVVRLCHIGALRDLPRLLEEMPAAGARGEQETRRPAARGKSVGAAVGPVVTPSASAVVVPASDDVVLPQPMPAKNPPPQDSDRAPTASPPAPATTAAPPPEVPRSAASERDAADDVSGDGSDDESPVRSASQLTSLDPRTLWDTAVKRLDGMTGHMASLVSQVEWSGDGKLCARFRQTVHRTHLGAPAARKEVEGALAAVAGQAVPLVIAAAEGASDEPAPPNVSVRQQRLQTQRSPLVQMAIDLFDADVVRVETSNRRSGRDAPARDS